jgi:hypothetical protein
MTNWHDHVSRLSHSGGVLKTAQQGGSTAALVAATEALRATHTQLLVEIEAMRKQQAVEKRSHAAELAAERKAHDAALAAERTAHDEHTRQLAEILSREFGQHSKRLPTIERSLAAIDEVWAR